MLAEFGICCSKCDRKINANILTTQVIFHNIFLKCRYNIHQCFSNILPNDTLILKSLNLQNIKLKYKT